MIKIRTAIQYILKLVGAFLVAGIFMSGVCYFYNFGPNILEVPDGATRFKLPPYTRYVHGTEGYGYGKTNNDGYYNLADWDKNRGVDVLLMGGSHTEGIEVPLQASMTSQLSSLFEERVIYNIGISGHTFPVCVEHLDAALQKYQPAQYIVIETGTLDFSNEILTQMINDSMEKFQVHHGNSVFEFFKQSNLLRFEVSQVKNYFAIHQKNGSSDETVDPMDPQLLEALFQKLSSTISDRGGV